MDARSSHPYRAEDAAPSAAGQRRVPMIVCLHLVLGGAVSTWLVVLALLSAPMWFCVHERFVGGLYFAVGAAWALVALVRHLPRRLRALRLLRAGVVTYGTLSEKHALPRKKREDIPVYRMRFQFDERGRSHVVETRTSRPAALEDDRREQIVYLPQAPAKAILVDELPGRPRVLGDNAVAARGHAAGAALGVGLLAATVAINVVGPYFLMR